MFVSCTRDRRSCITPYGADARMRGCARRLRIFASSRLVSYQFDFELPHPLVSLTLSHTTTKPPPWKEMSRDVAALHATPLHRHPHMGGGLRPPHPRRDAVSLEDEWHAHAEYSTRNGMRPKRGSLPHGRRRKSLSRSTTLRASSERR